MGMNIWVEEYCKDEDLLVSLLPPLFKALVDCVMNGHVVLGITEDVEEMYKGQKDDIKASIVGLGCIGCDCKRAKVLFKPGKGRC